MSFFGPFLVWLLLAAVLVASVVLAMKVSLLFLIATLGLFTIAFIKFGCLTH